MVSPRLTQHSDYQLNNQTKPHHKHRSTASPYRPSHLRTPPSHTTSLRIDHHNILVVRDGRSSLPAADGSAQRRHSTSIIDPCPNSNSCRPQFLILSMCFLGPRLYGILLRRRRLLQHLFGLRQVSEQHGHAHRLRLHPPHQFDLVLDHADALGAEEVGTSHAGLYEH